ncbi:MAG: DNA-directed RNA polymerase subunit beta', partial [Clostridia bacterium]|nr:DNA-directed RNA polymerase subunit beta' [Clostridia bacterium]
MSKLCNLNSIRIGIASPEKIREWSHGEVTKPETINYRTFKPEKDGLFCEKIFGPTKDWECHCGKYKRIRYKGVVCDKCGVEVTKSKVRRTRLGHIELAAPVSHIWYFRGVPSRMGLLLDISPKVLEQVLYFQNFIVLDAGETGLYKKQILSDREYREALDNYGSKAFRVGMGAEAI